MANDRPLMTGLFPDRESAERGYNTLADRGYSKDEINVVMSDETKKRHFAPAGAETELGNKAAEGAGVGGAIGGTVGAIAAAIAAVGAGENERAARAGLGEVGGTGDWGADS